MSKGYGRVQRELIEALRDHAASGHQADLGMSVGELVAVAYYGTKPWPLSWYRREEEVVAVRRALRGLAIDGVVVELGQLRGERRYHLHCKHYRRYPRHARRRPSAGRP
jgi:hypothetical protein